MTSTTMKTSTLNTAVAMAAVAAAAAAVADTPNPAAGVNGGTPPSPQDSDVGTVGEQARDLPQYTRGILAPDTMPHIVDGTGVHASIGDLAGPDATVTTPLSDLGIRIEGGDAVTGPMSATFADVADLQAIADGKPVIIGVDLASKPDTNAQWPAPPRAILPTVGRKVWFFPNGCTNLHSYPHCIDKTMPMDATITFPWSDRMVNLQVIDHIGQVHAFNNVHLVQPADDVYEPGTPYATWMPFQVGQARAAA